MSFSFMAAGAWWLLNEEKKKKASKEEEISGIFEIHLTVQADTTEKFVGLCNELNLKPVLIELPYGQHPEQFMTSSWITGTSERAKVEASTIVKSIEDRGYKVLRVKVEAGASNKGVPEDDSPNDPNCYFEFHIKVNISEQDDGFADTMKQQSAHLSANSLKGDPGRKFVTLRIYNCGRKDAFKKLDALLAHIKNPIGIEREYCIMDTNTLLDKDWVISPLSALFPMAIDTETLNQAVSLGTSIMAVVFDGGVILGADSRTTTGSYIANRVSDKLTPLHDRIFCCRSGSAADTQALADIVRYHLELNGVERGERPAVNTAAVLFKNLCYNNKDQLQAGIIVAGWDKYEGGSVYNIPLGGSLHKQPFAIGGSGSTYIYGYCDSIYRPGMTREESEQFVVNALSLAMSRDGSSGGIIRLAVITEAGVERKEVLGNELPVFWQG